MTQKYGKKNYKKMSLKWYSQGKKKIGYENCYSNKINSTYLAKARINSLQLEDHLGRGAPEYDGTCKLCKMEKEDFEHFLIKCPELEKKRNKKIMKSREEMTAKERTIQRQNYNETGRKARRKNQWKDRNRRRKKLHRRKIVCYFI